MVSMCVEYERDLLWFFKLHHKLLNTHLHAIKYTSVNTHAQPLIQRRLRHRWHILSVFCTHHGVYAHNVFVTFSTNSCLQKRARSGLITGFPFEIIHPWIDLWTCPLTRSPLTFITTELKWALALSSSTPGRSIFKIAMEGRGSVNRLQRFWKSCPLDQFLAGYKIHIG